MMKKTQETNEKGTQVSMASQTILVFLYLPDKGNERSAWSSLVPSPIISAGSQAVLGQKHSLLQNSVHLHLRFVLNLFKSICFYPT